MTSSTPLSAATGSTEEKRQKGDVFRPAEGKDQDELTLESLRASKLNQNTSAEDVRAPGIFVRVKEEVQAIAEAIQEDHLHHKSSGNQAGCFSCMQVGFARGLGARVPHGALQRLPLSPKPRRAWMVSPLAEMQHFGLDAGISAEERVESALTDFILDGSKTTTIPHKVWQGVVHAGDTVIDATCGNGHDTLMLAKLVLQEGSIGQVIGLDLQQTALDNTTSLLDRELTSSQGGKVKLQLCHSQLNRVVDEDSVRLVAFNLGYQPGGNKSFITQADTTVKAVGAAVNVLQSQGLISIMSYVGHPGGREEYEAVREYTAALPSSDWVCSHLEWTNRPLCPHLLFLLKK